MRRPPSPTGFTSPAWTPLEVTGIDAWTRLCSGSYVPLATVADPGFRGAMYATDVGAASISQIGSTPAVIQRGRDRVRSDPRESLILSLFLTTGGTVLQGTRPVAVPAGGGYLLDSDVPYSVRFHQRYDMLALRVPTAGTGLDHRHLADLAGRSIHPRTPELAVLRSHLALTLTSAEEPGAEPDADRLLTELVATLAHRLRQPERPLPRLSNAALVAHSRWYLAHHHTDPDLDVADVARVYGVSRRHLEILYTRDGAGPGAHLRHLRLRRASQLLAADPAMTVSGAARRAGFSEVNTFIRAFRRQWALTPDDWRRSQRPVPAATTPPNRTPSLLTDLSRLTWTHPTPRTAGPGGPRQGVAAVST